MERCLRKGEALSQVYRRRLFGVKGKRDLGVFGVSDVQHPACYEGVASLGAGVAGVDVGGHRERLLVQLSHHDAVVDARGEHQPQSAFVRRHFEVGLGVVQEVDEVVVQSILNGEGG
ncbi:hypothetical protein JZ751_029886 [Albula glossodonta]|uniref:Uncharacterized protein n=1 Tax=Albula glossodonta TaxID=121402 RepID=A0A8T2NKU3_9TELE|nr:hypothetical protein JZ751_029886 [Albula glossodonta]